MECNRFQALIDDFIFDKIEYSETIEEYHIASYMSKEDVILNLKYSVTMQGIEGVTYGVLADESIEEITIESNAIYDSNTSIGGGKEYLPIFF